MQNNIITREVRSGECETFYMRVVQQGIVVMIFREIRTKNCVKNLLKIYF